MLETIWNKYVEIAMAYQPYAPYVVSIAALACFVYAAYAFTVYFRIWLDNRYPKEDN